MDCRIITKDRFYIIGLRSRVQLRFTGENEEILELEKRMTPEIKEALLKLNDTEPKGLISVSASFEDRTREGSFLDQYIGVASSCSDLGTSQSLLSIHLTGRSSELQEAIQKRFRAPGRESIRNGSGNRPTSSQEALRCSLMRTRIETSLISQAISGFQ